jgi:hypothetical protein
MGKNSDMTKASRFGTLQYYTHYLLKMNSSRIKEESKLAQKQQLSEHRYDNLTQIAKHVITL